MNKVYPAILKSGHSSVRLVHLGGLICVRSSRLARDSWTSQNEQYRGCRRFRRCIRLFEHPDRAGVRSVFSVCVYSACASACVPSCNWFSMHREIWYWHKGEERMENSCLHCLAKSFQPHGHRLCDQTGLGWLPCLLPPLCWASSSSISNRRTRIACITSASLLLYDAVIKVVHVWILMSRNLFRCVVITK